MGDMNGHIGAMRVGYEEVVGCFGYGVQNREGMSILDSCKNQNLVVLNTLVKMTGRSTLPTRAVMLRLN